LATGIDAVGRIGLPALELAQRDVAGETFHMFLHVGLQPGHVDLVLLQDILGAGKL